MKAGINDRTNCFTEKNKKMKMAIKRRMFTSNFASTERLASAIGNGGLADVGQPIVDGDVLADKRRERDTLLRRVMAPYPLRINRNKLDTLYGLTQPDTTAELTYFFHPDHLGSASWITDLSGQPVQHLQYKPFGGDYIDQQDPNTEYSERFRFTGKERDAETGFDYFGARYYSSSFGIWLSVDPMSDKYPSLSPYIYCADNPMRLVDPIGEEIDLSQMNSQRQERLVKSLSYITGLKLSVDDKGLLRYADLTGNEKGSASARADLISAIDMKNEDGSAFHIDVVDWKKSEGGRYKSDYGDAIVRLSMDFKQGEDNQTNGIGLAFMHELGHAAFGDIDPEDVSTSSSYIKHGVFGFMPKADANLGEAVTRVNRYRKELCLPLRLAYPANPKTGLIPFYNNNTSEIIWREMH